MQRRFIFIDIFDERNYAAFIYKLVLFFGFFFLNGNLVHFAAFKKHIGFYPGAAGIAAFQDELAGYKSAKGSVQFPLGQALPLDLVKKIVKFRVAQNLAAPKKKA